MIHILTNNTYRIKKFINFQKIKTKFDLILIAVAHDYLKNIGLNRIKKKLNKNGKIFDLKSLLTKIILILGYK